MAFLSDRRSSVAVTTCSGTSAPGTSMGQDLPRRSMRNASQASFPATSSSASTVPPVASDPAPSDFVRNLADIKSFSQNARFRRHASLDLGVAQFRARQGSEVYLGSPTSSISPTSSNGFFIDEKARLYSFAHDASDSPLYSPFAFPRRTAWWKKRGNVSAALSAALTLFFLGGLVGLTLLEGQGRATWWGVKEVLEDLGVASFEHSACENPFAEFGRMHVDKRVPENNRWIPYDPTCAPPAYMALMRSSREVNTTTEEPEELLLPLRGPRVLRKAGAPLSWMHGKTVLLFGDHVERNHNKDFCRFAGGKFASIGRDHPLSPPRFVNGIDEKLPGANQENFDGTRPSVCYFEELDFMVISVFHFGLANRVEFEHESLLHDPHFYPPVALDDRLSHIVMPLLDSLHRKKPDLIEFSSGFWDLRHFAALDKLAGQDPRDELSTERLSWYSTRLTRAMADLGSAFPDTPLLWRTLHQTPDYESTSPARVAALDQISRKVAAALNEASHRAEAEERLEHTFHFLGRGHDRVQQAYRAKPSPRERVERARPGDHSRSGKAKFLNRVKQRIGSKDRVKEVQLSSDETSLRGRVRVDEWGALMRGQEHTMEKIHTPPLPGGFLWGDIMLFELRRVVTDPHAPALTLRHFRG